jgi:hypothetical protein
MFDADKAQLALPVWLGLLHPSLVEEPQAA